jgi:hypothetical protein
MFCKVSTAVSTSCTDDLPLSPRQARDQPFSLGRRDEASDSTLSTDRRGAVSLLTLCGGGIVTGSSLTRRLMLILQLVGTQKRKCDARRATTRTFNRLGCQCGSFHVRQRMLAWRALRQDNLTTEASADADHLRNDKQALGTSFHACQTQM